jgi:hypothetical protein
MDKLSLKKAPVYQFSSKGIVNYVKGLPEFKAFFMYLQTLLPLGTQINNVQISNNIIALDIEYTIVIKRSEQIISIPENFPQEIETFLFEKGIHFIYFDTTDGELHDHRRTKKVLFIHRYRTELRNMNDPVIDFTNKDIECNSFFIYMNTQNKIEVRNIENVQHIYIYSTQDANTQIKIQNCINVKTLSLSTYILDRLEISNSDIGTIKGMSTNKNINVVYLKNIKVTHNFDFDIAPKKLVVDTDTLIIFNYKEGPIESIDCMHSSVKLLPSFIDAKTKLVNTENAYLSVNSKESLKYITSNSYMNLVADILSQKIHFISIYVHEYSDFLIILQKCTKPIQTEIIQIEPYSVFDQDSNYTINTDLIPISTNFIFTGYVAYRNEDFIMEDLTERIGRPVKIQIKNPEQGLLWYEVEE